MIGTTNSGAKRVLLQDYTGELIQPLMTFTPDDDYNGFQSVTVHAALQNLSVKPTTI